MIAAKSDPCRVSSFLMLMVATWVPVASRAEADDYSPKAAMVVALSKPMTSIIDGRSFRDGLRRIADQARVNVWLDRKVDPSRAIRVGPVGPTVFAALEKLAASHDCVVAPMENVVLVGRPEWVDQTLASLSMIERSSRSHSTTIRWDDLTTPREAMAEAGGTTNGLQLPHDLWPAASLAGVTPKVAITLILAQFDLRPQFAAGDSLKFQPVAAAVPKAIERRYFPGGRAAEIRQAIAEFDPNHRVEIAGNQLRVTASPAAHRRLVANLLQPQQAAAPDPNQDTFTVRKMSTSAANALQQLAASAGKKCVIDPSASDACQQMVTVEGKDVTLKELVALVAKQAGVQASWNADSVVITKP